MAGISKCLDTASLFDEKDIDELASEILRVNEDSELDENAAALEAAARIVARARTVRDAILEKTGPLENDEGVKIVEVADGFEAVLNGKTVGRLKDTLARGQAAQLNEPATIDIVKVDADVKGKGVGRALYQAFFDKHDGRVAPSGKTTADAWRVWKRNYPEKVDEFVEQERARIAGGADPQIVAGNITDAEVKARVLGAESRASTRRPQTETEEFKRWFGDSKVVDAEGKPLVVYHGTNAAFASFEVFPAFFTQDAEAAGAYAEADGEPTVRRKDEPSPNTVPTYLSIKRPFSLDVHDLIDTIGGDHETLRPEWADFDEWAHGIVRSGEYDGIHITGAADYAGKDSGGRIKRKVYDQWVAFHPEQIKSAIGNRGTFDPADPDIRASTRRWDVEQPSRLDNFLRVMQDKQIDLKRVVAAVKSTVSDITDSWNPYLQEELYHGRTAKQTKDFLDLELRPLLQELQARGSSIDEFETFLHNRHAQERNEQIAKINPQLPDGGSGIETADAQAYLAGLPAQKRATLEALAKRVDAISRKTQKLLVTSGLEKQETIDAWNSAYKNYVPLQREEYEEDRLGGTGQGFSVRGSSTKRAIGSTKEVSNILANLAAQRERVVVRAEKNRVATALYGLTIKAPNKDFWFAFAPDRVKRTPQLEQELGGMGLNPIDVSSILSEPTQQFVDPRSGLVVTRVNPALRGAANVVSVRINGEDRFVLFNDRNERAQRTAAAVKNLDADQLGRALGMVATATRWFASVNTQYNPVFGIVNGLRDVQGAALNLSTTELAGKQAEVIKNAGSALAGIYSDIRAHRKGKVPTSKWAQLYEEFQKEGGQTGFRDMFASPKDRAEALEAEFKKLSEGNAKAAGRAVFDWLSDYNESIENAVRLSAYKVGLDNGMTKQQAASLAKNLTVNFNRKGTAALQAGALYAFFNASVQGTARLVETLRGPTGQKIIYGGLLLGAVQALALSAAGFGEDDPPEFVKERNIVIPTGDGTYLTVPMPLGFHVLPSLSRIPIEWAMSGFRDTPARLGDLLSLFAETFNPIGNAGISMQTVAPTVLDPLAGLLENKDFTGRQIAKEDFNPLKPTPGYLRAKDTATEINKALAYLINRASGGTEFRPGLLSPTPDQLDYLVGQVTGGVGRELMKLEQTITSQATGEELPPNKVPLLGRFYGDTTGQASHAARFYGNLKRLNGLKAEIDGRREARDFQSLAEFRRENPEVILIDDAEKAYRQITELKRRKRDLVEKGAEATRVKLIEERTTAVMRRLNDRVERFKERAQ